MTATAVGAWSTTAGSGIATIVGAVILLLFLGSPSAVAGLVPLGVVDAVDGVLGCCGLAHVSQESDEAAPPSGADGHALGAVFLIAAPVRVRAALDDSGPDPVNPRLAQAVRGVALKANASLVLGVEAATRARFAALQDSSANGTGSPTITATVPLRNARPVIRAAAANRPPPEALSGQVLKLRHGEILPHSAMNCQAEAA